MTGCTFYLASCIVDISDTTNMVSLSPLMLQIAGLFTWQSLCEPSDRDSLQLLCAAYLVRVQLAGESASIA